MEPPDPSFTDEFNAPQVDAILVFDVRQAAVSLPSHVHRLKVAWSPSRVRVLNLRTKSQKKLSTAALRTFRRFFQPSSRPFEGCCCGALRVDVSSPDLSVVMLRSSQLPHRAPRTNPVLRAALRARYQFGHSEKHDVGHVGGDVTDAGAIGDWWYCVNHRVRSLASKVRVSHQLPKVGQLRSFLGTVPLPPVWCGPASDADFRVHEIVIRFWCL